MKYARIVCEAEAEDNATEEEILNILEAHLGEFMNNPWGIEDVEIHEHPYIDKEVEKNV